MGCAVPQTIVTGIARSPRWQTWSMSWVFKMLLLWLCPLFESMIYFPIIEDKIKDLFFFFPEKKNQGTEIMVNQGIRAINYFV